MKRLFLSFFLILHATAAWSAEYIEDFSSRAGFSEGTAIWNQSLEKVHPSLQVTNFKAGPPPPIDFTVGEGEHGVFELRNYAQFSVGGDISGNTIRFDTDNFSPLKVTNFHLEAGWTLQPVGSKPFIVYSLRDVIIEGEIWCFGENGTDANNATPGSGGASRCGGTKGGDGAAPTLDAEDGTDVNGSVGGGLGGNYIAGAGVGGGGGGSWNTTSAPGNGPNSAVGNGEGGASSSDPEFITIAGGAGGGGGGSTLTEAGGGGGGGGGAVIIHTVRDFALGSTPASVTGFIYVNGGNGGSSNVQGGPGGGGAGGSIKVFAGRNIDIFNTDGAGASRGAGGTGGNNTVPVVGATGGPGRSWYTSVGYNPVGTGFYTPGEDPSIIVANNVKFSTASQVVVSNIIDLQSTKININSLTTDPVSNDFTLEVSGSSDQFISEDTGWTTNLALVKNKRYLRFRLTIATTTAANPTMVDSVTINYTPLNVEEFEFEAAACGKIEGVNPSPTQFIFLLFPLFFVIILKFKSHLKEQV